MSLRTFAIAAALISALPSAASACDEQQLLGRWSCVPNAAGQGCAPNSGNAWVTKIGNDHFRWTDGVGTTGLIVASGNTFEVRWDSLPGTMTGTLSENCQRMTFDYDKHGANWLGPN